METELTPRQREVALALARGQTQQQAAEKLGIDVETVRYHVRGLKKLLGVSSSRQIGLAVVMHGIVTAEEVWRA